MPMTSGQSVKMMPSPRLAMVTEHAAANGIDTAPDAPQLAPTSPVAHAPSLPRTPSHPDLTTPRGAVMAVTPPPPVILALPEPSPPPQRTAERVPRSRSAIHDASIPAAMMAGGGSSGRTAPPAMNRYASTPLLRTFTSHLRQKLSGGSGSGSGGAGSAGKGRRASEFTGVGTPTSSPGPSSVVGTPASLSQPNLNPTVSSASASSSTTNTLSHHLTVGSSTSSVPRSRSMNELFGHGASVRGKRLSVLPHGERTPPLAAAAARSRDESVAAARKIQTWWRMRQMRLHFSHILKRAGSGASIVAAQRPSGSRGGSGDDPLRRGTRHYVLLFNQDPREAVEAMRSGPLATYSPDEADDHLVEFLRRNALTLDKTRIGELFGLPDPPIQRLLHAYMASLPLDHLGLSDALRAALATFRLPGEAQKIDRVLDAWARAYCAANPGTYRDPTTAFVLAFSVIMLNTDAHNPAVKKKMTLAEFIRNNRGIDAGGNVPEATLRRLYYDIKCCAIRMQDRADPGEMAVVKAIAGMENSRSKLVAEFIAFKVIKGAKHERFVFLFKDVLVITKQKPGPKYLVNHQWPIQAVTVYPASNSSSDYDIPHSVYLGYDDEAEDTSPMTAGTGGSAGSGGVGSTSDLSNRVHLAFSTPEEHEVFLKQLSVAKVEQSKQHEVLTDYLANRVARTKSTLERRYRSVSEDPAAAAPHLTRDPSGPPSRPSTPPTTQLFAARHLATSPAHHNTPPPLVVSPPPPPPPSSSTDDIDGTTVPLPRSPTAPLSPIAASPVDTASPPSPTDSSIPASPQLAAPPSVIGRAGSMRTARVALQRESAANAHAAHLSRAMVLARARSSSADVAPTGTASQSRRGSVAEESESPISPPIVTDPVADLAPPAAMGTPPPQARARSPTLTSLAAWIRRASTISPTVAVGPALPASPTLSDAGATKSAGTIPMTASTSVSSGLVSPPPIEVTPAGSREDGSLTGSGGVEAVPPVLSRSPSANGVLKRIGSFVVPSRNKSIVPGPAMAGVVRAAQQQQQQQQTAVVAGTSAASMPAMDMDGKLVQGDGRTHPTTTCPASDDAITVVAAGGADGLVPTLVAGGGRSRSRSRSASTVYAGMTTREGL